MCNVKYIELLELEMENSWMLDKTIFTTHFIQEFLSK